MLTTKTKKKRYERCLAFRNRFENASNILFTHEKLFMGQRSYNPQNILGVKKMMLRIKKNNIVFRVQEPSSVMVWAGVCATGKTPLIFIEKGIKIKINQHVYKKMLQKKVKP